MGFLSRKFLVFILLTIVFWAAFIFSAIVIPEIITGIVFIVVASLNTLLGIIYIGGNVWQKIIQTAQQAIPAMIKKDE